AGLGAKSRSGCARARPGRARSGRARAPGNGRMKLSSGAHLTYCTNIHPGETWEEVRAALRTHLPGIAARIARGQPFAVGLRLSARAAAELDGQERAME